MSQPNKDTVAEVKETIQDLKNSIIKFDSYLESTQGKNLQQFVISTGEDLKGPFLKTKIDDAGRKYLQGNVDVAWSDPMGATILTGQEAAFFASNIVSKSDKGCEPIITTLEEAVRVVRQGYIRLISRLESLWESELADS